MLALKKKFQHSKGHLLVPPGIFLLKDIATGARGLGSDFQVGQIGQNVQTPRHRCDVS